MTPDDLSLVATNDLVAELERRYTATLMAFLYDKNSSKEGVRFSHSGGFAVALGLAEYSRLRLRAIDAEMADDLGERP